MDAKKTARTRDALTGVMVLGAAGMLIRAGETWAAVIVTALAVVLAIVRVLEPDLD